MSTHHELPATVTAGRQAPGGGATAVGSILRASGRRRLLFDSRLRQRVRLVVDLFVLYIAAGAATLVAGERATLDLVLGALFPLLSTLVLRATRAGVDRLKSSMVEAISQAVAGVSLSTMLIVAAASIFGVTRPLDLGVRLWLYGAVYLAVARGVLVSIRHRAMSTEMFAAPTLIIGAGLVGSHLARRLSGDRSYGLRPVGLLDPDPLPRVEGPDDPALPVLGGLDSLAEAVRNTGATHVILAFSSEPDHLLAAKIAECRALGLEVSLVPRLYESINERTTLDHVGGLPLLTLHEVDPHGWQFAIKHAIDVVFTFAVLFVMAPLMLIIVGLIRLSSPGPILFRQRRVGRDGHEFDLLKFRTMRVAPPEEAQASFILQAGHAPGGIEGVDRRTRIGRLLRSLSLDELPQLYNVLRGDMSLVGPRPERPEYVTRFSREVVGYENRHRVRSGMTGWAQVHGLRGQTSIADRVEWDNWYILNWSLRLDLRILMMTVAEVLRFREGS